MKSTKDYLFFMCQMYRDMYTQYMINSKRYTKKEIQSFKLPCTMTAIKDANLIIDVPDALLYFDGQYNIERTEKARRELIEKYNGHFSVLFQRLFRKYVKEDYIVQDTIHAEWDDPLVYFYIQEQPKKRSKTRSKTLSKRRKARTPPLKRKTQ